LVKGALLLAAALSLLIAMLSSGAKLSK